MRISSVFVDLESDLRPEADRNMGLVIRRINDANDIEVLSFSPKDAYANVGSDLDLPLQAFDRLLFLPLPNSEDDEFLDQEVLGKDEEELDRDALKYASSSPEVVNSELDDEETEDDKKTRLELLEPVIRRLEQQAYPGNPAPIIRIAGAVRLPGKYPLIAGGTIGEQVRLAGGFSDDAFLNNVEVRRLEISKDQGASVLIETLDLSDSKSQEYRLKPRDTLRINTIPNYSTEDTVELSGEFVFLVYTRFQGMKP